MQQFNTKSETPVQRTLRVCEYGIFASKRGISVLETQLDLTANRTTTNHTYGH